MQRLKALLFVVLLYTDLHAQQAPAIEWADTLGGSSSNVAYSIVSANGNFENNYLFTGYTFSLNGDFACPNASSWVVSVDRGGILWRECLCDGGSAVGRCIIRTSDGGYAIAGHSWGSSGICNIQSRGGHDVWVAKLDKSGNVLWDKSFGGSLDDEAYSIVETNDEGRDLVIVGSTNSADGDVSGWHSGSTSFGANPDAWVVRMSSQGDIRWQKCLGGTGADEGYSIIQTKDGGFAISGVTTSNDGDVSGNHGSGDVWIIKLDANGGTQWQKCYGGSNGEQGNAIIQTSDSGYAIAAQTKSNDGDVSGWHLSKSFLQDDGWILKLDPFGDLKWQKCLGGSSGDVANSIIQISGGDYVIGGSTNSHDGDAYDNRDSGGAWILRLSTFGGIEWQQCYGFPQNSVLGSSSILSAPDGGYVFAAGGNNVWVVKLAPDTGKASVETGFTSDFARNFIKVYPNPSVGEVQFSVKNLSVNSVGFYDVMGRQHFPKFTLENNAISCDVHDLSNGIYITRLNWTGRINFQNQDYRGSFSVPFIVQH